MENIELSNPFSTIWGTIRNDIPNHKNNSRRLSIKNKENMANEKREKIRRIGFDYMDENYIEEDSIDINRIVINRNHMTNPKGIRIFEVFYDKKPLIVKVYGEANILIKGGEYQYIQLYMNSLNPVFSDFISELNSNAFINRILENEISSTKYSITGSKIIIDNEIYSIEGSLKVRVDESCNSIFTPFMPINDFDSHTNIIYPSKREDLDIQPREKCKVICYLYFSSISATNSNYTFTIFCKKCGYEVI